METVIVVVIVAFAAGWAGWRLFGRRPAPESGCGSGCGGCSCAARPQPAVAKSHRLVNLRRR